MLLDLPLKMYQSSRILLLLLLFVAQFQFSLLIQHLCNQCRQELCPVIRDCGKGRMRELDECGCCTRCTKSVGEPCGGLEQLSCSPGQYCAYRPGRTFGYFREGFCEPNVCADKVCGFRQQCHSSKRGPVCSCPLYLCNGKHNPVCGSDGVTYNSLCHLRRHECTEGRYVGVQNLGPCQSSPTELPLDPFGNFVFGPPPGDERGVSQGCTYKNGFYKVGQVIPSNNPCLHLECQKGGAVIQARLPGCPGSPVEEDIGEHRRPVHGKWRSWSSWSQCSGTCSKPVQTRSRMCIPPQYEGRPCEGAAEEQQKCILRSCERKYCEPVEVNKAIVFKRGQNVCTTTKPQTHRRCVSTCTKSRKRGGTIKLCCKDDPSNTVPITADVQCTSRNGVRKETIQVVDGCICKTC